jgi:hypothetical protein
MKTQNPSEKSTTVVEKISRFFAGYIQTSPESPQKGRKELKTRRLHQLQTSPETKKKLNTIPDHWG